MIINISPFPRNKICPQLNRGYFPSAAMFPTLVEGLQPPEANTNEEGKEQKGLSPDMRDQRAGLVRQLAQSVGAITKPWST